MRDQGNKILYINLGNNIQYSYDKPVGRILGWSRLKNSVYLLAPEIDRDTLKKESQQRSFSFQTKFLPLSSWSATSVLGLIFCYFTRVLVSPAILFNNWPHFDFVYSNSAFLVDVVPALLLKIFGKVDHWIVMIDSVVPDSSAREGLAIVNHLTFIESQLICKLANRFATVVFTVNPELKKILCARGLKSEKIFLSKNGLFLEKISRVKKTAKYNYTAVYQGRITANKGVFDMINIWAAVVKKYPQARLAIMGSALNENLVKLKDLIKNKRLEKNIDYLGFTPAPKKYQVMKSSKIFIYLSKVNADESWGISLMEALACGLPAITYNLPIYRHIYKTNSVISVDKDDKLQVTDNIKKLLNNQKLRLSLSNEAIKFSKQFNWQNIAKEDLKIIINNIND